MNLYQEVINSTVEMKTLHKHMNKLSKVKVRTEDQELIDLLDIAIAELYNEYSFASNKSNPVALEKSENSAVINLIEHCKKSTEVVPKWQLLAEANGWAPKES